MAYIGNSPANIGNYQIVDSFSGFNGSTTTFALSAGGLAISPAKSGQILVAINGVLQEPDDSGTNGFKIVGSNIVFSSAPANGDESWAVYQGQNVDIGTPSLDTVGLAELSASGTASNTTFLRGDNAWAVVNTNLVADTSPQLGGNLDLNSKNITGTGGIPAANLTGNVASARLASIPAGNLTGTVPAARLSTVATQAESDNSTKIATTAYVQREVSDLLGGAPAAFDTLLEISASIANGDSDVVSLTTTVGTKLAKSSNLSDLTNASTSRTNLGVDAAGTDNSTNVTLVTSAHDYLSVSGQAITLGSITNDDLAGSIAASKLAGSIGNSKLSNSAITVDGNSISLGGSVSTLQLGTSNSTALAGNTTTISGGQASAITAK